VILDTTVIIDLMRENRAAVLRLKNLQDRGEILIIPTPAIFEIWEGGERADRPEQETRKIQRVLRGLQVRAFDEEAAIRAGRLAGLAGRRGHATDPVDVMIAGMALQSNEPVLTRNGKDFRAFDGLEVVDY
jgi:predicted nucleic acid-binding protein